MKRFLTALMSVAIFSLSSVPVSACCLWPFGWWGSGYYSAGYAPYAPSVGGYYSAGYSPVGCCAPSLCAPCCGDSCSTGACSTGSSTGDSLKPESDSNFDRGTPARDRSLYEDEDRLYDRDRLRTPDRTRTPDATRPTNPADDIAPEDSFRAAPRPRSFDSDDVVPFGTGEDRINRKPPMSGDDGTDLPATDDSGSANPASGASPSDSTFFDADLPPLDEARLPGAGLASRTSSLNEVVAPRRLASRSLPATPSRATVPYAGKDEHKSRNAPIRWISTPLPVGHAQL